MAHTNAGTTIKIGTTQTSMTTDVYTDIGNVRSMGDFGREYNEITNTILSSRAVEKYKGSFNDGNIELEVARDTTDAGQEDVIAALDSDNDYNFRVEFNDDSGGSGSHGTIIFFKAKVMSYRNMLGGADDLVRARITLAIKSGSKTEVPAT